MRDFTRNQHRLNIELQSENYTVDDKFQCNIVYFSLIQDIKVSHTVWKDCDKKWISIWYEVTRGLSRNDSRFGTKWPVTKVVTLFKHGKNISFWISKIICFPKMDYRWQILWNKIIWRLSTCSAQTAIQKNKEYQWQMRFCPEDWLLLEEKLVPRKRQNTKRRNVNYNNVVMILDQTGIWGKWIVTWVIQDIKCMPEMMAKLETWRSKQQCPCKYSGGIIKLSCITIDYPAHRRPAFVWFILISSKLKTRLADNWLGKATEVSNHIHLTVAFPGNLCLVTA